MCLNTERMINMFSKDQLNDTKDQLNVANTTIAALQAEIDRLKNS